MAQRIADRHTPSLTEPVPAGAALGPVLDHIIHRPRRQQVASLALVAELGSPRATRRILRVASGCSAHQRSVAANCSSRPLQPTLELCYPLVLACDMSLELPNPAIHREENFNDGPTALAIDSLSPRALHNPIFDKAELCPPKRLNGYGFHHRRFRFGVLLGTAGEQKSQELACEGAAGGCKGSRRR